MNFVERIFGLSPDGGNGTLELSILLALTAIVAVVVLRRRRVAAGSSHGPRVPGE